MVNVFGGVFEFFFSKQAPVKAKGAKKEKFNAVILDYKCSHRYILVSL